jgi:hypothetical protein
MLLNYKDKRRTRRRQAGMTTLGMIILVSFLGLFAFAGIRLTPVYLNYMKVVSIVDSVRDEFEGVGASTADIRRSIGRRFDIESVSEITAKEVKLTKVEDGYEVSATYSHKTPFIANVFFLVDFDKRALIRR